MTQGLTPPSAAVPLAVLAAGIVPVPADVLVSDVTQDSRAVTPGALFLARRGVRHHGREFLGEALACGARAVLIEEEAAAAPASAALSSPVPPGIFVAVVPDLGRHVGAIAARFFGAPSAQLTVAGVTGTNGKTTCAWLLAQALVASGRSATYMGTIGSGPPGRLTSAALTTADAVSVQRELAAARALGAECVAMEVSSHALEQGRVDAVRFRAAAFTNLTRDHLDYHGTMQAYAAAKARLFEHEGLAARVINIDDPFGRELALRAGPGELTVTTRRALEPGAPPGIRSARRLQVRRLELRASGLSLTASTPAGEVSLEVPLLGEFNADNVLTVLGVLLAFGLTPEAAARALERSTAAPGRMQVIPDARGRLVIVDYAHTPDALAKALQAARAHSPGRLHVVFGCGGDRDRGKRPLMGRAAAALADCITLTDDNPRSEDPQRIVAEIRAGIPPASTVHTEHDRAAAIAAAIATARAGDAVLIAGKGHEDYQIQAGGRRPFSDEAAARSALGSAAAPAGPA